MIDFSKAFDKIDHNILLLKLKVLGVPPILLNWCADFLTERNLRVKLGQAKSSWHQLNASVPQGTRLGPIFFLIMINDLDCNLPIYKYVDDCTVYEIIPRSSTTSSPQLAIDQITEWTEYNNMSLNVKKTKELRISFLKKPVQFDNLTSAGTEINIVDNFKLLGVTISSDLTWNTHIDVICAKASRRLYALRILKRSGAPLKDIMSVYSAFIRLVLEYACQVWHFSIPQHLNHQIEQVQRRALRIALPHLSYSHGLEAMNIQTLNQRREEHCHKLYKKIFIQEDNKLKNLIPVPKLHKYSLRTPRTFDLIKCRTERLKSSFIPKSTSKWDNPNI